MILKEAIQEKRTADAKAIETFAERDEPRHI